MSEENLENNNEFITKTSKIKVIFGVIMVLIYLAMAYALIFTKIFEVTIQYAWMRYTFGCVFALYGFWRAYRQFKY